MYVGGIYYPIKQSQFTIVNNPGSHGTATITDGAGGINISKATQGGNEDLLSLVQSVPSTPYSVIAGIQNNTPGTAVSSPPEGALGMTFMNGNSSSSKSMFFRWGNFNGTDSTLGLSLRYYSSATNFTSGTDYTGTPTSWTHRIWMKIRDDGTHRTYWIGGDGMNWFQMFQESSTNNFTATYAGICNNGWNNSMNWTCFSFQIINS